ncbi:PorP/SprF family type IX secretion system membrane protein [Aquirufa ecclesiirivi]|uniref:PorP/SprF family type IX secretion system membrane protein n=1 Tax=Aquirufa ecclesiirivi TaxID=2715124 RepID=UPI003BAFDAC9
MRFFAVLFLLLVAHVGFAQQTPQVTQFMMNRYLYNPAFAGFEDYTDIKVGYRQQWVGLSEGMKTFNATANWSIDKSDRTSTGPTPYMSKTIRRSFNPTKRRKKDYRWEFHQGLGLQVQADQFGPMSTFSVAGSYAYHVSLGGEDKLSVGATGGYYSRGLNMNNFDVKDGGDPLILYLDPPAGTAITSAPTPYGSLTAGQLMANVGVLYYNREFFLGLSANQLIFENFTYERSDPSALDTLSRRYYWPNNSDFDNDKVMTRALYSGTMKPNLFAMVGYHFRTSKYFTVSPAALVKFYKAGTISIEANVKADFNQQFWMGFGYRHKESYSAMFGVQLRHNMHMSYSYDLNANGLAYQSMGSHEIVLGITINNRIGVPTPH